MSVKNASGYCALALSCAVAASAGWANSQQSREWKFRVYLDESQIGYHHFELTEHDDGQLIRSEARFRVKVLIFNAYEYEHVNRELWHGECLASLEASTNDNGRAYEVSGTQKPDSFVVSTGEAQAQLPECIKTFAYWDADFLDESRLLNPQTGEYVAVEVSPPHSETLSIGGEPVPARRYTLRAGELELDLWYSSDDEWLALDSTLQNGRKLRYRPI